MKKLTYRERYIKLAVACVVEMTMNLFCWDCGINFISDDILGKCPVCDKTQTGATANQEIAITSSSQPE
jgi:Zn finger protein HypA/HybF involved in hydrogenase expression